MDTQTLYNKIASVPTPISTWFGSDAFMANIEKMDDKFTLPAGSATVISKIVQRFQIKDIAPEYFSGELASELNLEKNKAILITEDIKKNIFSPIKKDLADYGIDIALLDKFQIPPVKSAISAAPKIIQDINTSPAQPPKLTPLPVNKMAPPMNVPVATTTTVTPAPAGAKLSAPAIPTGTAGFAPTPKPPTTSDIGWSKTQSAGPVLKFDFPQTTSVVPPASSASPSIPAQSQTSTPAPATTASPTGTPMPTAPAAPRTGAVGEFERLGVTATPVTTRSPLTGPAPAGAHDVAVPAKPIAPANITSPKPSATIATTPAPATVAADPAPMMLHEDTTFKADEKNSAFTLTKPGSGAEVRMDQKTPTQGTSRPVVLEFGGVPAPTPKPPAPSSNNSFVHYTEFKPSLSSVPTANSGPRNVSQIIPPPPIPPKPPVVAPTPIGSVPVPIPRPPQAQAPLSSSPRPTPPPTAPSAQPQQSQQKEKVIVKDFL
jgi:hypothetical protein